MIDKTLANICELQGVYNGCIYHQQIMVSTFPKESSSGLLSASQMIEQVFDVAHSINKNYEELYLLQDGSMLVAYRIKETYIVLLLTDIKLNLPLTHLRVKLLISKWLETVDSRETSVPIAMPVATPLPVKAPALSPPPTDELINAATQKKLEALQKLLIHHLGPAANWLFSDALATWKQQYAQTQTNLPHLLAAFLPEFDVDTDRQQFQQQANQIINH
ncbi:hypothetical protein [Thiothrix lacustris]|uniref:hypothetical protein n=1 Tax=Thiothrix lacustris TaxID=525917 RepID=UPI0027E52E8A|nr:hypothetical protein [Thiothrix lacustris]WMP15900.1 hypothetical protein RCS87_10885 [Thiothrix lacustris]